MCISNYALSFKKYITGSKSAHKLADLNRNISWTFFFLGFPDICLPGFVRSQTMLVCLSAVLLSPPVVHEYAGWLSELLI